ncbi:MAG: radical SAM family heme chaperone HemW [Ferruginibacter sp.]
MAGIYIHIPFCRQACNYCNFHFSTSLKNKNAFLDALNTEISLPQNFINESLPIETVYLGGGTPSLLSGDELTSILNAIKNSYGIAETVEITLEANPDDVSQAALDCWQNIGINRLSLGIQSFIGEELKWMNRAHDASQAIQSLQWIKQAGFLNYSVDLIYGSPLLSNEDFKKNADTIFQFSVPHISCYALTVEPKTVLNKLIQTKKSVPINPDKQAEQFELLMQWMNENGYEHYEISNFAKPGMRSQHNSSYWQGKPYYGFGPSAHSYNGNGARRWNIANNALYIQSIEKKLIPFGEEILSDQQQINEFIMIRLRTAEGIGLETIQSLFGKKYQVTILRSAEKFISAGTLIIDNNHLKLTTEGKFLADGIAAALFQ